MPKILIVEDEVELAGLVAGELRRDSYDTLVAHTAGEGLELWKQEQPDLVILDWVLPDMEGIEVCRKIRQKSVVPILMLTARGSEMERIWGLDVGADDYMIKPFSTGELRARVRAMLRRMVLMEQEKGKHEQTCIDYGFIRLNVETREVFWRIPCWNSHQRNMNCCTCFWPTRAGCSAGNFYWNKSGI